LGEVVALLEFLESLGFLEFLELIGFVALLEWLEIDGDALR